MTAATLPTKSEPKPASSPLPSASELVQLEPDEDFEEGAEQLAIGGEDLSEKRVPRLASPFFNLASPDPWNRFPFRQWVRK